MPEKKKILWHSDSPTCVTGFGNVARNMLETIFSDGTIEADLTVLGINYHGEPYDQSAFPYLKPDQANPYKGLWPAMHMNDPYGYYKLIGFLKEGNYDILFILNDPFILANVLPAILSEREKLSKKFKIIFYFPIDTYPKESWVKEVIAKVDYPVVYTNYGKNEILKISPELESMPVIYHGSDLKTFFPITGDARFTIRALIFPGMPKDCFLVLNVNRNQQRKDLNRTFAAFSIFHKKHPNSFLYIHASLEDAGGNLEEIASFYGLIAGKDWSYPDPSKFNTNRGLPKEVVNQIYAAADVVVSTTLGEGWGLSLTEAMACGKPVLFPRHTSIIEIIGENEERGTFIRCGGKENTIALGQQDNGRVRPLVDVQDFADKLLNMVRYPTKYAKKAELALEWIKQHTWESKAVEWKKIFGEALNG